MNDSIGRPAAGSKTVLVVEDTPSVADFLGEMLLAFGHHAEICLSVNEALASFLPGKYDLIITDYTMPGMNGVEFARLIKQQSSAQLIMLTTGSSFSMADSAPGSIPFDAILQKPFSVMEFQQILAKMFAAPRAPAVTIDLGKGLNHDEGHPTPSDHQSRPHGGVRGFDGRAQA